MSTSALVSAGSHMFSRGDQWLPPVTPHQGRPCHLLPTDRCSPDSRPALLWLLVSGLACGFFCTQPPTHALLVRPGDAAAAANAGFLAILEQREIGGLGGARPVPERRLPVKLVSTRRLSLAPVSPHSQAEVSRRRQGARNLHHRKNWSEVKAEAGQRGQRQ